MGAFLAELRQQPAVLANLARQYTDPLVSLLDQARALADCLPSPPVLSGMGSSNWAAEYAAALASGGGRPFLVCEAGELLHYGEVPADSLLVLISQSGESAETVSLAQKYRDRRSIVAVTNNPHSTLGSLSDLTLPLLAGEETGTTNKTFVASLAVLGFLTSSLIRPGIPDYTAGLSQATGIMADNDARWAGEAPAWYRHLASCRAWSFVARGFCVCAVRQGALIVKEMAGLPAEGYTGGTFRHGPLELSGPDHGVVVLAPRGATRDLGLKIARETAALGSPTLLLTDAAVDTDDRLMAITLPATREELAPFLYITPLEYLAIEAAKARGYEPGVMRRARKITADE